MIKTCTALVKGVKTCFNSINRCDQHSICDQGVNSGEIALDEYECSGKYKDKGLTSKDATFKCQSPLHNKETLDAGFSLGIVMIEAVPFDGIPTSWKGTNGILAPDQRFCDNELLTIWVPGENSLNFFFSWAQAKALGC